MIVGMGDMGSLASAVRCLQNIACACVYVCLRANTALKRQQWRNIVAIRME